MRFKHEKIIKVKAPKSGSERLELVLDPNWILTPDIDDDRNDRESDDRHPDIEQSASNHSNHSASTTETDNRSCTRVSRTFSSESDGSASRTDFENDVYAEMERRGELHQEGEEDYYSTDKPKQNPVENFDDDEYYAGLENDVSVLQNSLSEECEKFDAADDAVDDNVEPYDEELDVNPNQDCDMQYHVNNGACLIKDAAVSDEILITDSLDLEGPDDEQDLQEHQILSPMSRDFDDDDDHEMPTAISQNFDDDPTEISLEYDQPLKHDNRGYNKEPPRRGVSFDEDFLSSGESNRSPVARTTPLRRMQSDDTSVSSVGYRVVKTASKEKMEPIQIRTRTTSPSILRQPKYTSNVSVSSNGNAINHVQSPKSIKNTRERDNNEQKMNEPVMQPSSNSVFSSQSAKRTNGRGDRRVSSHDSITTPSGVSSVQSHGSNSAVGLLARSKQKTVSNFLAKPSQQQRQQEQQQRPQRPPPKPRQNQQTYAPQQRAQIGVQPPGFSLGQQTIPSIAHSHSGLSVYSEGVRSTAALDGYVEEQPRGKRFLLSRPKKPTRTSTSTVNVTTLVSKKTRLVTKLFRLKKKTVFAPEEERGDNFSTMRHPMSPGDSNPELSQQTSEREPPISSVLYRRSKSSQRIDMPTSTSENDNASIASETSAFSHHSTTHGSRPSNLSHAIPSLPPPNQQQPPSSSNNYNRQVSGRSTSEVDDNPWSNTTAPEEAASVKDPSPEDFSNIDIPPNDSLSTVTQIASVKNNQAENPKNPPAETTNLPNDSVPNTNPPDGSYNMDGSGMPAFKWWTWSQPDDKREQGKESRYCALMCVFPPATE